MVKIGLASTILVIQLLSLRSIKKMIVQSVDCTPKKMEFYEHIYVFTFFAFIVFLQSVV